MRLFLSISICLNPYEGLIIISTLSLSSIHVLVMDKSKIEIIIIVLT